MGHEMKTFLKILSLILSTGVLAPLGQAAVQSGFLSVGGSSIYYGVYESQGERRGDLLYFHGYGDRFQNHEALFQQFNAAGFRVIGFDMPSHGDTLTIDEEDLNRQTIDQLATIASSVLKHTRSLTDAKPLFFAGWSIGGLIATRAVQNENYRVRFPKVDGLILYAPSVALKPCVGNFLCLITNDTLSHNESFRDREIKPNAPLKNLAFGARLLFAATQSWSAPLPPELKTLVFLADDDDQYVMTQKVKDWVGAQRANYISEVSAYQCKGARHELDNEPLEYGGAIVRSLSVRFAEAIVRGDGWDSKLMKGEGNCQGF
jgi:pimeloyl-ACP methyl ester carboxylesterase